MRGSDLLKDVNNSIYKIEALLKAIRVAAFDLSDKMKPQDYSVPPEDYPYLMTLALSEVGVLKDVLDDVESTINRTWREKA